MECHLETSSRNTPNEIRAYDRPLLSYRPGQPLGDYKYLFDREEDATDDTFEVAHPAYRLRKSKCFLNSQMTCLTCHNPHDIPRGKEATKGYVAVCQSCHEGVRHTVALAAGTNCISCHMPKRRAEDVVHVVMTDHYIRSNQPKRNLLAPLPERLTDKGSSSAVVLYYPTGSEDNSKTRLYVAVAQAKDGEKGEGIQRLQALLDRERPSRPEPYVALGRAYLDRGNNTEAVRWFDAALKHAPDNRPALEALGPALIAMNQDDQALEALKRGVTVYPKDDMLLTNLGNVYLRKNMPAEAHAALNRAIAANPEQPDAFNLLGLLDVKEFDKAAAEKSFREAIRLQPDDVEAQTNLATLLAGKHALDEARFHFLQALRADPASADAHHGLGLLLILQGSLPEATAEMREAVRLQPGSAQNHDDFADLLAAQGAAPEAAEEYAQVLRLKPDQSDAQLGLGMALLQQRRLEEATVQLNRASLSSDPEVSAAAKKVLSQLGR
jgi:tetratricopeptide (TPR) repeat protein